MPPTNQPALFTEPTPADSGPVECLGLTFENDAARRAYFTEKLREKLQDPAFRQIEGFPIGSDEDILALSDPPYYTACPNPFLEDFIEHYGKPYDPTTDRYRREPFAADVSEGKNDPIYNAHSYHTKVPHKAIMRYILHYTEPGDVVLDGFCGTGMTGVAAQLCGDRRTVESLGYLVQPDGVILDERGQPVSRLGTRRAVLCDLSPAATFIAYNYNTPVDVTAFEREARRILREVEEECGWMYETLHTDGVTKGRIDYTVWSEVKACPNCAHEIIFTQEALDEESGRVKDEFPCPNCGAQIAKKRLELLFDTHFDSLTGKIAKEPRRKPVLIIYKVGKNNYEKQPDETDLEIFQRIETLGIPSEIPLLQMPDMQMNRVGRMKTTGVTHIHHFFLSRQAHSLAALWRHAKKYTDPRVKNFLLFFVEQAIWGMSVLARYVPTHYSQVNQYLSGVFYVASQISEVSPWYNLEGKLNRLAKAFQGQRGFIAPSLVTTENLGSLWFTENSLDYIFTDPPFGENIYYSDLNILVESWHRVRTAPTTEAIIDRVRGKDFLDYQQRMQGCFSTYYRLLKPGRWMTVEFHNSKNSVWNAIQQALQDAGFVIADVRTLDKGQGSFQQVTSASATKQDLVISCYKPNGGLEDRFKLEAGTEAGAWDFVRTHLRQLPVFVSKDGRAEVIAERLNFLLFDRMVAFHVQRGVTVPLSAAEFYAGLEQRFPKRDEMYFLPDQVAEYDQKRMQAKGIEQLQLFVTDESSAIQWLRLLLTQKPQTFQEIHPQFMQEIAGWQKYEKSLELADLLEQNFLRYEGETPIPAQLWTSFQQDPDWQTRLKGHTPDNPPAILQREARHRWYVPNPNQAADLEKLRERELLKEFEEYRQSKQKQLKVFRLEAVRAGFKKAWQAQNKQGYDTIIEVADKIPEAVLQEDPKLLMWYDQAVTRTET